MNPRTSPRRSRWIPWSFVGGFGVVIVANVILIVFALNSWSGLETDQAYVKGLAYNETIATARAQAKRGWQASVGFAPSGPLSGELVVSFVDAEGEPVTGLAVTARLIRPTHEGFDRETPMAPRGAGRYVVPLDFPLAGQWQVRVEAEGAGAPYRLSERIMVR
ncbi:MAG: FixH family protein [Alphaproteobacteria bacterium]